MSRRGISPLKAALSEDVNSAEVLDTLLSVSRELAYQPGQLVALCRLAGLRLQKQQPQAAKELLQQAEQIAAQINDLKEARWAMSQIGKILKANIRLMSPVPSSPTLGSVMETLGKSMRETASRLSRDNPPVATTTEPLTQLDRRGADKRTFPDVTADYIASLPRPTFEPRMFRQLRVKPDFADRWLDTLIHSEKSSPQVVQQLTEQKKRRDSSQELSNAFAKEGDYAKAYQYFLQYTAYKDSLTAEATSRRLASLTYKQNLLKKEAQIQLLTKDRQLSEQESNRQRQFVLVLVGCLAVLGAFSLILTRNNRAKHRANQQLSEQKEALQQTLAQLETTQTQLVQAEKMASLGELTAGIAHEIQNPLNFVNNFSEVSVELVGELREEQAKGEPDLELVDELFKDLTLNLEKITYHGGRASNIVKGMLEHARSSTGRKEPTNLNVLADEYLRLVYVDLRTKDKAFNCQLTTDYAPDLGLVTVMPQELGRVLLNLFTNAFYAVREKKKVAPVGYEPMVSISTSRVGNQVQICVRDNGIGIPDGVKGKIFQPFFTTKPTGEGTGLGLSLSYDIVTKGHSGQLTVNGREGEGTGFVITLPTGLS
ncbi:ATP-binding protein [Spirosoma sp.]|uniref:sensor histidine kinase n=1 Tax=Spirosoma sp. TaxID=1899569 RepID=UPI00261EB973|nr:ATP-binding protein [Spirosoma sp.]MCX6218100.1 ATP-binding protein [Spirosoma sp.]